MERTSQQIRQFIKESGISLKEFKHLTGLSSSQVMRWCAGDNKILRDRHVRNLEIGLCASLESLKQKLVLNKCFFENFRGETISISDRYVESARSFVRSSSHVVKYLELLFGRERIRCILKEMAVHRSYFDELDNKINILFFVDLLEKCRKLGLPKSDLRKVASAIFLSIDGAESERLFKKCTDYREAYENVSKVVHKFDTNFYYDFKVRDHSVEIAAEPHESIVRLLEKVPLDYLFHYRLQVFGTVTQLCGLDDLYLRQAEPQTKADLVKVYTAVFPESGRKRQLRLV